MIICGEPEKLERHLETTADRFDVTKIFNQSGFTPIHLAAYKMQNRTCEVLINFVLSNDRYVYSTQNGRAAISEFCKEKQLGVEEDVEDEVTLAKRTMQRRYRLRQWLNQHTQGEDSFTALHFASFHGNFNMIRLFIKHGSDIYAQNKSGVTMMHVCAQGD